MKKGERLNKRQMQKLERLLREHADMSATEQVELLRKEMKLTVSATTVYRYRNQLGVPPPKVAMRLAPISLSRQDERVLTRLLGYLVVPFPSDLPGVFSLETPGLDEVSIDDENVFRIVVGENYTVESCWFTSDERLFLESVLTTADQRRGSDLQQAFTELHSRVVEFVTRAYWYGIQQMLGREETTPAIRRIPEERLREVPDADAEREWLRITNRQIRVRLREFRSGVELTVGL